MKHPLIECVACGEDSALDPVGDRVFALPGGWGTVDGDSDEGEVYCPECRTQRTQDLNPPL